MQIVPLNWSQFEFIYDIARSLNLFEKVVWLAFCIYRLQKIKLTKPNILDQQQNHVGRSSFWMDSTCGRVSLLAPLKYTYMTYVIELRLLFSADTTWRRTRKSKYLWFLHMQYGCDTPQQRVANWTRSLRFWVWCSNWTIYQCCHWFDSN